MEIVDHNLRNAPETAPYYVMPWAKSTLRDSIPYLRGADGLERTLRIASRVARTLSACHSAEPRVIHRDVKPANILLDDDDLRPMLADFGICFFEADDRLTRTEGNTVGSEGYTAPELFGGGPVEDVGPAADVYSLGKTLYAVASGGVLFPLDRHRDARWLLQGVDDDNRLEHLHGLLDRMTALRPEERYQTMAECADEIDRAIHHVRSGIRYVNGMYSGGRSPGARLQQVRIALAKTNADTRNRAFVGSLSGAVSDARNSAVAGRPVGRISLSGNAREYRVPQDTQSTVAAIVDDLLSPVAAVMSADDQDPTLVGEWAERLATEASGSSVDDEGRYFRAGVSVAFHVAGGIAWRRGLTSTLAVIVNAHLPRLRDWNHLDVFDRASLGILQVAEHVAMKAASLACLDAGDRASIVPALPVYAGILLLRDLHDSAPDVQRLLEAGQVEELEIPALPCLVVPYTEWTASFGDDCAASPIRRQALSQDVFGLTPTALQSMMRRYRNAVARAIVQRNPNRAFFDFKAERFPLWGRWS